MSPVSPNLLAGARTTDTARLQIPAASSPRERHPEIISFPQRPTERTQPVSTDRTLPPTRRPEIFRFLDNNLMEIDFSGKVFIKQGTIYSYGGNLTFWVKERRPGGHPPLVMITGTGKVILTDRERARFLTPQEVADLLRVSSMTVYRLIKAGELRAVRVGKAYRILEDDVDAYLADRFTQAG